MHRFKPYYLREMAIESLNLLFKNHGKALAALTFFCRSVDSKDFMEYVQHLNAQPSFHLSEMDLHRALFALQDHGFASLELNAHQLFKTFKISSTVSYLGRKIAEKVVPEEELEWLRIGFDLFIEYSGP